ncbi:MAG: NAD(+) diphosphatase [Reinekea sp.]
MLYEFGLYPVELPGQVPELTESSRLILWHDNQVLMNDYDIAWQLDEHEFLQDSLEYVARLNGKDYFTAVADGIDSADLTKSLRDIAFFNETAFMLCGRARAHLEWRDQHRFCSRCAAPLVQVEHEFAMQCEPCRMRFYPRISPCVIVLITNGRKVLLAQGERHQSSGWYSTIAGFIESGESAEQAVVREVKEEVNVDIQNICYMNSQAWPFPNQLMLGFHAEYAGGEIIPAPGEIAQADWFDINDLPKHPPAQSILCIENTQRLQRKPPSMQQRQYLITQQRLET